MSPYVAPPVQMDIFDALESEKRKRAGMARAASAHGQWLEDARAVAVRICRLQDEVCADDLRAWGVEPPAGASPNIMGSVFNDARFEFAGYTKSKRPEAHSNLIRRWRLSLAPSAPVSPAGDMGASVGRPGTGT